MTHFSMFLPEVFNAAICRAAVHHDPGVLTQRPDKIFDSYIPMNRTTYHIFPFSELGAGHTLVSPIPCERIIAKACASVSL